MLKEMSFPQIIASRFAGTSVDQGSGFLSLIKILVKIFTMVLILKSCRLVL